MAESYTTDYRTERMIDSGSLSFTNGSYGSLDADFGVVGKSYAHNLGYRPLVRAFAVYPGGEWSEVRNIGPSADSNIEIIMYLNSSKILFSVFDNATPDRSVTIYFRLYTETA